MKGSTDVESSSWKHHANKKPLFLRVLDKTSFRCVNCLYHFLFFPDPEREKDFQVFFYRSRYSAVLQ